MDRLRILFVHRKGLFTVKGGEQDQIVNTKAALEERGVEVTLVDTIPDDFARYDLAHFFGLDVCHIPEIEAASGIPIALTPVFWDRAQGFAHHFEFQCPKPVIAQLAYRLQWLNGRCSHRLMKYCRSQFHVALRAYGEFQRVIDRIDLFLPNSQAEMTSLSTFYIIAQPRHRLVPNAIDLRAVENPSDYAGRELGNLGRFVVCSGGIDKRKNQYGLLHAMLDIDVPIVFAGNSRGDRAYFKAVKQLATRRRDVFFLGHLSPPDLHSVYRAAAVHALPSFHDTPGISNLEAVAHECVNVGTQIGGLREYLGEHGLYCNPFSVEHIREQVLAALQTPTNVGGAELVKSSYTYEQVAEKTLLAYQDLLDTTPTSSPQPSVSIAGDSRDA